MHYRHHRCQYHLNTGHCGQTYRRQNYLNRPHFSIFAIVTLAHVCTLQTRFSTGTSVGFTALRAFTVDQQQKGVWSRLKTHPLNAELPIFVNFPPMLSEIWKIENRSHFSKCNIGKRLDKCATRGSLDWVAGNLPQTFHL